MSMYKRECIISTRTDLRLLAALATFYKSTDELARTKSSLVGDAIEDFVLFLASKDKLKIPATTMEALEILKGSNFNFINRGSKFQRSVIKTLADEEYDIVKSEVDEFDSDSIASKVGKELANK